MTEMQREIRQFIADNFIFDQDLQALSGSESLTQTGVIDSMGVLELIMFLEETYSIKIPDEETLPENLDTIDNIVRYLQGKLPLVEESHDNSDQVVI